MEKVLRIGTRDSQLAVWQATKVQELLLENGIASELVRIKSEGDPFAAVLKKGISLDKALGLLQALHA